MSTHDATFYVQVEPVWLSFRRKDGEQRLREIRVVGITQQYPTRPRPGVVIAKLTLRIPDGAFLPLQPEAVVIPEDMIITSPLEVTAEDPS